MSSTAAAAATKVLTNPSVATKVYQALIGAVEPFVPNKFQALWNHPAGNFKTTI